MAWTLHLLVWITVMSASPYKCKHTCYANYTESRRDQNSDLISEELDLQIPEDCLKLGICEDIPNYPTEQATKVISEACDSSLFQADALDMTDEADITRRVGPLQENIELCRFESRIFYPKAAVDRAGQWYLVLNRNNQPVQGFKVEICKDVRTNNGQTSESGITEGQDCSRIAQFMKGYQARCKQKYVYRSMQVLQRGSRVEKRLKVPSCCSCVTRHVIN